MDQWLAALAASPPAEAMRTSLWLYPLVNTIHLLAAAAMFSLLLAVDLRLLGLGWSLPADALMRHTLPWVWAGFGVAVLTGLALFAADARVIAANEPFRLKLLLLGLAGANALAFHRWSGSRPEARLRAAGSLALRVAILSSGRLIAYW